MRHPADPAAGMQRAAALRVFQLRLPVGLGLQPMSITFIELLCCLEVAALVALIAGIVLGSPRSVR
jgi:hypothetical protein